MSSVHLRLFDAMVFLICPAMCLSLPIWCYGISHMSCSPAIYYVLLSCHLTSALLLSNICSPLWSSLLAWPVCCHPTIASKSWIPKSFSTYYFRINSLLLHPSIVPIDHFDPITEKKPSVCIINTDPCDEPGSHWVAVFIKSNSETEPPHSYGLLSLNEDLVTKLKFFSHVEFYTTKLQGYLFYF